MLAQNATIESEFSILDSSRSSTLERKRECASLVLPHLLPDFGHNENIDYVPPYSASPARMTASLASKIVATLVPLNNLQYFEIGLSDTIERDIDPTELIKRLSAKQTAIVNDINNTNFRECAYLTMQHLIVVGDALVVSYDNGSFQVHRIDNYVVERFGDGRVHKIILREWVNTRAIPEELKKYYTNSSVSYPATNNWKPLYTKVVFNETTNMWEWSKEFCGSKVSSGEWEISPYFPLRWKANTNDNYGISLCEENIGDLRVIQGIAKAIIDGIAINSELRWGIDPTGITEPQDLSDSDNGDFVPARQQDLFPIQANSMIQVDQMNNIKAMLERSLARVFLMETEIQPQQDRVTATQINTISNELQRSLTGVLPMLNRDLMQTMIRRWMYVKSRNDEELTQILKLIKTDVLSVQIRTGMEALGREVENSQIGQIVTQALQLPTEAQRVFKWPGVILRWLASTGINTNGLTYTQEELDAQQQQMMQQQLMMSGAQAGIDAAMTGNQTNVN